MAANGGEELLQYIISQTPRTDKGHRGEEVKKWLFNWGDFTNNAPISKWVIFDDSRDYHKDQPLVWVSGREGLLLEHVEQAEKILGIY